MALRVGVIAACAGLCVGASGALADVPGGVTPLFYFEHDGLDDLLGSEHDASIKRSLRMLTDRVSELLEELGLDEPLVLDAAALATAFFEGPTRIIATNDEDQSGGAFGYGLVVSVPFDAAAARGVNERVLDVLAESLPEGLASFEASDRHGSMMEALTPGGTVRVGPVAGALGPRYELHVGSVNHRGLTGSDLAGSFDGVDVPAGFDPFLRFGFDLRGLTPGVNLARAFAGGGDPSVQAMIDGFAGVGLIGPDAVSLDLRLGSTADGGAAAVGVARRVGDLMELAGTPREPLSEGVFAAVPADARWANITRSALAEQPDLTGFLGSEEMAEAAEEGREMALAMISDVVGFDVEEELLGSLGSTTITYSSAGTGDGGIGSIVLLLELSDAERFEGRMDSLRRTALDFLEMVPPASDYVGLVPWRHGVGDGESVGLVSARGLGLPVPIEPTYGVAGDWLVLALSPAAAAVAAEQIMGAGDAGLMSVPAFRGAMPADGEVHSVAWVDTSQTIADGYGVVTALGTLAGNLVRSPGEPEGRDPAGGGLMVPTLASLRRDARPLVSWSSWEGDDMIFQTHGDRSMLVNGSSLLGMVDGVVEFVSGLAIGAGAAGGLGEAFEDGFGDPFGGGDFDDDFGF